MATLEEIVKLDSLSQTLTANNSRNHIAWLTYMTDANRSGFRRALILAMRGAMRHLKLKASLCWFRSRQSYGAKSDNMRRCSGVGRSDFKNWPNARLPKFISFSRPFFEIRTPDPLK